MSNKWYQIELLQAGNCLVAGGLRPFAGTVQANDAHVSIMAGAGLQLGTTEPPGAPTPSLSELSTKDVLQT